MLIYVPEVFIEDGRGVRGRAHLGRPSGVPAIERVALPHNTPQKGEVRHANMKCRWAKVGVYTLYMYIYIPSIYLFLFIYVYYRCMYMYVSMSYRP